MAAQLKPGSGPLEFGKRKWLQGLFAATLLVLYLPIFVLVAYSFNIQNRGEVASGLGSPGRITRKPGIIQRSMMR